MHRMRAYSLDKRKALTGWMPVKYHKLITEHAVNAKYKSLKCCSTHYPHSFSEWGKQWSPGGMLAAKSFVSMHCMGSSDVLSLCRHASCG